MEPDKTTSTPAIDHEAVYEPLNTFLTRNKNLLRIYFFMEWGFIIPLSLFVYMAWGETNLGIILLAAIALLIFFHIRKVRQIYSIFYKYFARIVEEIDIAEDQVTLKTISTRFLWVYFPTITITIENPIVAETEDFPNFGIKPLDRVYVIHTDHGPFYIHKNFFDDDVYQWLKSRAIQ